MQTQDRTQSPTTVPSASRGPRTPDTSGASTEDCYTFASAVAGCPVHRQQHAEFQARRAEYDAAIDRLDRRLLRQLDLRFSRAAWAVSQ